MRGSWPTLLVAGALMVAGGSGAASGAPGEITVGSKSFTENYILAEIVATFAQDAGEVSVRRRLGLGGTGIVYEALARGDIDVYPEYTGTISRAILNDPSLTTVAALRARLQARGLAISDPLGFRNTYALAVRREVATRRGLRTISDLRRHPELRAAFDPGFLHRDDAWPGLRRFYGLTFADVRIMEHALTHGALASGRVDLIDVFSTDGQLSRLDAVILEDDRGFFPDYAAVLLARQALVERFPRTWAALQGGMVGKIDERTMIRLNAIADVDGRTFAEAAAEFRERPSARAGLRPASEIPKLTVEHLYLVFVSLAVATAVGVPLGIVAARRRRLGQLELMGVGVLQTVPALALLSFMIPLFGIGTVPALVALCLYALLPIVRNTHAGLASLDAQLVEMAAVLGLSLRQRLSWIDLPLAAVTIMAGIKTAAVLTVGTATLAAFIGGGGYGTLIITGLAMNSMSTILAGAIPAALMALAIHGAFEALDRLVIPRAPRQRRPGA